MARAYNERLLHEQFHAMRHLPPGTHLPHPDPREERDLLARLLSLDDDQDPRDWLRDERGRLCSQIALWRELEQSWQQFQGQQRAGAMGHPARPENQALLSRYLAPDQAEAIFSELSWTELPPAQALRDALSAVRACCRDAGEFPASTDVSPFRRLFVDLLNLPDDIDPLGWLQTERGPEIALETFGDILSECCPPRTMIVGEPIRILSPRARLRVGKRARIHVEEVLIGSAGFTVTLKVELRGSAVVPDGALRILWHWLGFDRVTDDQGYAYVVQHRELSVGGGLRNWSHESLRLAYYPALATGSTSLCFTAEPITLDAAGMRITDRSLRLPSEDVGDLTYRLALPEG